MAWRSIRPDEPLDLTFLDGDVVENADDSAPESFYSEDERNFDFGIDPYEDYVDSDEVDRCQESSRKRKKQKLSFSEHSPAQTNPSPQPTTPPRESPEVNGKTGLLSPRCSAWKTEMDLDIKPDLPRFTPKHKPGVQPPLIPADKPSPLEIFKNFFDDSAVKIIVDNTNKNAVKNSASGKKFEWTDLTAVEFFKFLGLLVYMGILNLPKLRDMWRVKSIFHVPFPRTVMTRNRFMVILWNLHMSDPAEDVVNDSKKGTEEYDCLHRVNPLCNSIQNACKSVYHPYQSLSVDERMVATNAKIRLKQHWKLKPTKWGTKLFVLADTNGYTVDFKIYTGKMKFMGGKGLSFDAVTSLVKPDFLGSGYHIYCDNFFTSPALFTHLSGLGFGACGTYREGRMGTPTTKANALTKKSPRGSMRWIRDGKLLFVKWMDTQEVSVCSTIHTAYSGETTIRGMRTSDGGYKKTAIPRPTPIGEYNKHIGGVDMSNQLLGYYSVHHRTTKWYKTLFYHFIDIAVTNSYILHREMCAATLDTPMKHQDFQELLSAQLMGVPLDFSPGERQYNHTPVAISPTQDQSMKGTVGRKRCVVCKRKTPLWCKACLVPLCVIVDRNCHDAYHM